MDDGWVHKLAKTLSPLVMKYGLTFRIGGHYTAVYKLVLSKTIRIGDTEYHI